jgi:hypothetical protein
VSIGRSLLSFDGDYLKHDCCRLTSLDTFDCVENGDLVDSQHEIFRINITQSRPDIHGPAFVEVSIIFFDNIFQMSITELQRILLLLYLYHYMYVSFVTIAYPSTHSPAMGGLVF